MSQVEHESPPPVPPSEPPKMVAVRRRTRRRRSDPPVRRKTLTLLLIGFVLVFMMVAIPPLRQVAFGYVRQLAGARRPPIEVSALIFAGLVIIYLLPGVEDKVLTTLGIRKKRRSRNSFR